MARDEGDRCARTEARRRTDGALRCRRYSRTQQRQPAKMVIRAAVPERSRVAVDAERANIPAVVLPFTVGGDRRRATCRRLFDDTITRLVDAASDWGRSMSGSTSRSCGRRSLPDCSSSRRTCRSARKCSRAASSSSISRSRRSPAAACSSPIASASTPLARRRRSQHFVAAHCRRAAADMDRAALARRAGSDHRRRVRAAATAGVLLLAGNVHGSEHLRDLLVGQILWVQPRQLADRRRHLHRACSRCGFGDVRDSGGSASICCSPAWSRCPFNSSGSTSSSRR